MPGFFKSVCPEVQSIVADAEIDYATNNDDNDDGDDDENEPIEVGAAQMDGASTAPHAMKGLRPGLSSDHSFYIAQSHSLQSVSRMPVFVPFLAKFCLGVFD